jgi:hypothetical protein
MDDLTLLSTAAQTALVAVAPFMKYAIDGIKSAYKVITKTEMPIGIIITVNILLSFILSVYYAVFVTHAPMIVAIPVGLVAAAFTAQYHDNKELVRLTEQQATLVPVIPVTPVATVDPSAD